MMEVVHQITIMYKYKEIYKRIKENMEIHGITSEEKIAKIS